MVRPSAWQKPWFGDALLTASGPHEFAWGRIFMIGGLVGFLLFMSVLPLLAVGALRSGAGQMLPVFFVPLASMLGAVVVGGVVGVVSGRRAYRQSEDLVRARRAFSVAASVTSILLIMLLVWAALLTGRGLDAMPMIGSVVGFFSVFVLIGLLVPVRLGPELRCARCDYPFATDHGGRCPECGSNWRGPLSLARGERKGANLALVALLAVLVLPTATIAFVSAFGESARFMTTESLIRRALNPSPTDFRGPWDEIDRRSLNEEQTLRLARGVVGLPASAGSINADRGMQWLEGRTAAGEIPGDILEELLEGRLTLELRPLGAAVAGEPLGFELDAKVEGIGGRTLNYIAAVGGYSHEGGVAVERGGYFVMLMRGPHGHSIGFPLAPPVTLTPIAEGEIEVRFDCWVFLTDRPHGGRITWRADGTPEPPPGALAEVHKEATTTLRVGSGP